MSYSHKTAQKPTFPWRKESPSNKSAKITLCQGCPTRAIWSIA